MSNEPALRIRGYELRADGYIRRQESSKILGRASGYPPTAFWYQIAASVAGTAYDPPAMGGFTSLYEALRAAVVALEARAPRDEDKPADLGE